MFFFKKKVKDDPNPWLKIPHDHNWLEASNGAELVCGDCGLRKKAEYMAKKQEKVVVEEVIEVAPHVVTRPTDCTVNDLIADKLPSLND